MNTKLKSFLFFLGGTAAGVGLVFATANVMLVSPLQMMITTLVLGLGLLLFGSPHKNPGAAYAGWSALGLTVGIASPFIVLFMFMAG